LRHRNGRRDHGPVAIEGVETKTLASSTIGKMRRGEDALAKLKGAPVRVQEMDKNLHWLHSKEVELEQEEDKPRKPRGGEITT